MSTVKSEIMYIINSYAIPYICYEKAGYEQNDTWRILDFRRSKVKTMKYIECKIHTNRSDIENVLTLLIKRGITDAVVNDPADIDDLLQKEHGYEWDYIDDEVLALKNEEPTVVFYLDDSNEGRKLLEKIEEDCEKTNELSNQTRLQCEVSVVNDEDWKDNWKAYFKPAKITDTIVVKPTWEDYSPENGEKVIEIDPGMAFGTGTHQTTSLCIKLMEKNGVKGKKVLDVGCGSGILSIAAGLLGASDVLGIEIDPIAVTIARENVELNGLSDKVEVRLGDLTKGVDYKANLIVANLMADLVMMLSKDAAKHLTKGGIYITSGILIEKEEIVRQAIEKCGFEVIETAEDGEWCTISARAL